MARPPTSAERAAAPSGTGAIEASAIETCAREVRVHDRDRYLCALFAPADARPALLALAAFNLELARVREAVSEPLLGEIRLQWWRDAVAGIYAGEAAAHPVALALADAVASHDLTRAHLDRLVDARALDLTEEPPADLAALEDYAEGTAASLVSLGCEALGVRAPAAHAAARHVGIAWALVGLVRAVPFHAARRRLYLPRDLLEGAGMTAEEVFQRRPPPGLARVAGQVLDAAERRLADARAQVPEVPRAARPALLPAALAELYLARLRRAGNDPFAPGLDVGVPMRLWRLWRWGRY